ncbi:MAG: PEP-CTERM sorting domain-containing protein [Gammaproteobacteria bacterium]
MHKKLLLTLVLASTTLLPLSAAAVIIDFDNISTGSFTGPASEDGFTYSLLSGALRGDASNGNPGGNMQGDQRAGGVLSIARMGGGRFTFDGTDIASFEAFGIDVLFEGLLLGTVVGSDTFTTSFPPPPSSSPPSFDRWSTHSSSGLAGIAIDELRVDLFGDGAGDRSAWAAVDNIVLTAVTGDPGNDVPEPTSLALLALGVAGAAARRRRRRA